MPDTFRCAAASRADAEPMVGTAPTETVHLLVEHSGAWGRKALAESRLPEAVKERLGALAGVRVSLVRRHGGLSAGGVRVFTVHVTPTDAHVETCVLDRVDDLLDLDLDGLAATGRLGGPMRAYEGDLHLVCTNGSRDLCCAESGRPVAAALAARWPEATWEVTHLGGHRFAGTLMSFPSAICLGRLDAESAVLALEELEVGRHPLGFTRGRVGLTPAAQVAQVHVVEQTGLDDLGDVLVLDEVNGVVRVLADGVIWHVGVRTGRGEPRRQSCADLTTKPATVHTVVAAGPVG